nr:hypothetical protein [Desulfobacterales bacterium]
MRRIKIVFSLVAMVLLMTVASGLAGPKTVQVFGPFQEPESIRFEASYKSFEEATGIDVVYT